MAFNNDPLIEINYNDISIVQETLKKDWPRCIPAYCWIDTRLKWQKIDTEGSIFHVCTPKGGINDGLIMFGKMGNRTYLVTLYTFHNDTKALEEAFRTTKRLNWSENFCCAVPTELADWMKTILRSMGYQVHEDYDANYYELSKNLALSLDQTRQSDVYIEPLKPDDIHQINSAWPFSFEGSEHHLMELIKFNSSCGLYSSKNNCLLSWVMKCESGEIGVLQTDEEFKRRGYAKTVVKELSKKMAENDDTVYVYIVKENVMSIKLFESLGFKYAGTYSFMDYHI